MTPRLWSWSLSPFAGKARVALVRKEVEVELIEVHPVNRPPQLRRMNPTNRVPVLELEDVAVRESTPICEWAEETGSGPSLWPADPALRAAARGLLRWVDDELTTSFFLSMRKQAFGLAEGDPEDLVATLQARLTRRWPTLEALLTRTDGPWLFAGHEPTLPDLAALPLAVRVAEWAPQLQPDPDAQPHAAAWLHALRDRPEAPEVGREGSPAPEA